MSHARRRTPRVLAALLAVGLLATAACGGKKDDAGGGGGGGEPAGDPVRGGEITYGLEAETGDGWCLPEAQLAISGIMVARTIYDTLTVPNSEGEMVPYLAKSVEPNEEFTEWTITLRDGVTFHDGSPLTAEVVKNNLDAYRGVYEARPRVLLFRFVLDNIDTVEVAGDLEVTVTTKVPWIAFPSFLYSSGRLGMVAQDQLDDTESCDTNLIGTGPFKLESWQRDQQLVAVRNPDYWQMAPDGQPYPYLDKITFQPIVESEQRINSLQAESLDVAHFSAGQDIKTLEGLVEDGIVSAYTSDVDAEVAFLQMNASKPPFDDPRIREAVALSIDGDDYIETINGGQGKMANGPFASEAVGFTEDTGYPDAQDLDAAKALVEEYEAEEGDISIQFQTAVGRIPQQLAAYMQQRLKDIGIDAGIQTVQQDQLIDNAIGGTFDIMGFRNYPGGDPDLLYVWFKGGSPVNFSRFQDAEIDALLDEGRSETDPARRAEIYEEINREFGKEHWYIWLNWTTWMIASQPEVHGYDPETFPELPDGGGQFSAGLPTGHPLHGLWVEG